MIVLLGASGLLGEQLQKQNPDMLIPTHKEVDISFIESISKYLHDKKPDVVINAAAIIDNRTIENNPAKAIITNIVGAANVAIACLHLNTRLVYISTDYVYQGTHGNCKEDDPIQPFNFYAWTKLGGECSTRGVKNHLIIRTSFGSDQFTYKQAFVDKWASKDYVDVIAPMIYEAALSPLTGILNIGTERKTLYDYASRRNEDVMPVTLAETNFFTPYDTSLNLQKWIDYKASSPVAKPHTKCRCCGSKKLVKYLDLGLMPMANNLEYTSLRAKQKERFPLQVMFCEECGLSQLSVVIDPEKMFSYYAYRSSVNGGYVRHCRQMAHDILPKYFNDSGVTHIDIAGNDGTLLKEFVTAYREMGWIDGYDTINIDPATNLAAISEAQGIHTIADFWSLKLVNDNKFDDGTDLITATNVFAHVDDISEFLIAARTALRPDGILVIECPYLIDFIENFEFDTVYFEHVSYMSIIPVERICFDLDLKIINAEKQSIHGGTVRITIAHQSSKLPVQESVYQFINEERKGGFDKVDRYKKWASETGEVIKSFGSKLLQLKKEGHRISGIAASAKGNTLLNSAGITTDIMDYIVDDTPEKIGKYSPGTGIPIVQAQTLSKKPCDYLVILSWNFADDLMKRARNNGFEGSFIIPIPEFTIL